MYVDIQEYAGGTPLIDNEHEASENSILVWVKAHQGKLHIKGVFIAVRA